MLKQMKDSVDRNVETTDTSRYNRFNAAEFLEDLAAVEAHVKREFTCIKE